MGRRQPSHVRSTLQHASARSPRVIGWDGAVRPGLLSPGADPQYRLPIRVITQYAWHSLFARNLFIAGASGGHGARARVHDHRRAAASRRPVPARLGVGCRDRPEFRGAAGAHRRHELRRRDQEVGLHDPQLPAAAPRRAVDALLGEHRAGRRRRVVLRVVGHGQDDALERSGAAVDWRRRARLERSRRVQLRRRMLRQDDPAVARG